MDLLDKYMKSVTLNILQRNQGQRMKGSHMSPNKDYINKDLEIIK